MYECWKWAAARSVYVKVVTLMLLPVEVLMQTHLSHLCDWSCERLNAFMTTSAIYAVLDHLSNVYEMMALKPCAVHRTLYNGPMTQCSAAYALSMHKSIAIDMNICSVTVH